MTSFRTKVISIISISVLLTTAPSFAQKAGQSVRVTTGIVTNAQQVKEQSDAGTGALIGGALGLLTGVGKSSSKKVRNTLLGAAGGGAVAAVAQGDRNAIAYTVSTGDGNSIRVVTDQTEIRIGDCVTVEETGSTANVRRMSPTACESASARAREELHKSFQQEAVECHNAKQQLVNAKTANEIDLARRKMKILCSD